LTGVHNFTN